MIASSLRPIIFCSLLLGSLFQGITPDRGDLASSKGFDLLVSFFFDSEGSGRFRRRAGTPLLASSSRDERVRSRPPRRFARPRVRAGQAESTGKRRSLPQFRIPARRGHSGRLPRLFALPSHLLISGNTAPDQAAASIKAVQARPWWPQFRPVSTSIAPKPLSTFFVDPDDSLAEIQSNPLRQSRYHHGLTERRSVVERTTPDRQRPHGPRCGRIADFFIIGAAKSGTTTLYDYLALHPQICMSSEKEPCYFNSSHPYSQRGLEWYRSLFSAARDGQICGEATTNYSAWPKTPDAPELIAQHVPHAKFIYMLREPVQRTYSHFIHRHEREVFVGKPYRMTFEEFAEHDPVVLYASDYASQVARYLAHFPKNSILPLVFEDFTNDRERALAKVFRFLEVEDLSASLGAQSMHKNSRKVYHADMARARIAASVRRWIPGIRPLFRRYPGRSAALRIERSKPRSSAECRPRGSLRRRCYPIRGSGWRNASRNRTRSSPTFSGSTSPRGPEPRPQESLLAA